MLFYVEKMLLVRYNISKKSLELFIMILKKLCPDVKFTKIETNGAVDTSTYTTQEVNKDKNDSKCEWKTSIEDFVENHFTKNSVNSIEKLWITGSPSMGKSVALDIIKIELNKRGVVFYSLNLRELKNELKNCAKFNELKKAISDSNIQVIVLDSYDEIDGYFDMDSLNESISSCEKTIILASRDVPEYKKIFVAFNRLELLEFKESKLETLIEDIVKNQDHVDNLAKYNLAKFVKTTMHLAMLLKLINSNSNELKMRVLLSQNIAEFYFLYFKQMVREKVGSEIDALRETDSFLQRIGRYYAERQKSFGYPIREEFRMIFRLKDGGTIEAAHQEYIDFCIGYYLACQIANNADDEYIVRKTLNIEFRSFEERRALLHAGQCLQITKNIYENQNIKSGEETFKTLNNVFVKDQSKEYAWLVHIWAAFNKNVLEDDEFVFQVGSPEVLKYILRECSFFKEMPIRYEVEKYWISPSDVLIVKNTENGKFEPPYMLVDKAATMNLMDLKDCYVVQDDKPLPLTIDCFSSLSAITSFFRDKSVEEYFGGSSQIGYGSSSDSVSEDLLNTTYVYPLRDDSPFYENLCMNEIERVMIKQFAENLPLNREKAILLCKHEQDLLSLNNLKMQAYKRCEYEFAEASDEDYTLLLNQMRDDVNPEHIVIDGSIYNLGRNILLKYNEESGENFAVPDRVSVIGLAAFYNCESIRNVILSSNTFEIKAAAFYGCSRLDTIVIPQKTFRIEKLAFDCCPNLSTVFYCGNESEWSEIEISSYGNDALVHARRYYYSQNRPKALGYYWHYVNGVPTVWE